MVSFAASQPLAMYFVIAAGAASGDVLFISSASLFDLDACWHLLTISSDLPSILASSSLRVRSSEFPMTHLLLVSPTAFFCFDLLLHRITSLVVLSAVPAFLFLPEHGASFAGFLSFLAVRLALQEPQRCGCVGK